MYELPTETGLIPKPHDPRTFNHAQHFGADRTYLDSLPKMGLGRKPISIENQIHTNFCTAFCTSTAAEYIEKEDMSPEFQVAKISEFLGYPILNGAPALAAMKAQCLFGSLKKKDAPPDMTLMGYDPIVIADPTNWPKELNDKAAPHKMGSYFDILRGPFDYFDNIKVALAQAHDAGEERVGMAFTQWFSSWGSASRDGDKPFGRGSGSVSWHAHLFIDWTIRNGEEVMIEQNSYGTGWGDEGLSYWSREAVNQLAEDNRNEVFMFRDVSAKEVKNQQWTIGIIIYDMLAKIAPAKALEWLTNFFRLMDETPAPAPAPTPVPAPAPAPTPAPAPVPSDKKKELLQAMCLAIKKHEGWFEGSRSYKNNNPGNARYSSVGYLPKYGHVGEDRSGVKAGQRGFAIFQDYATGYMYLQNLVLEKCRKHPNWNLTDFFGNESEGWAPASDNNDSIRYAKVVADAMRVDPSLWRIGNLL